MDRTPGHGAFPWSEAPPYLIRDRVRVYGVLYHRSISRRHDEVVEVHVAVGLGPQADSPRNRVGQDMLQVELAVEIGRDLGSGDADLEVVPLAGWGRRIANPFHRGPLAFLEFPQDQIIFQRICPDGEIVAVRLEVEQDTGTLIDAAGNTFEAHGDFAIAELGDVFGYDIGEIRIGLNAVEEFGI